MVSKKAVVLKMAAPALLLILLLDMSATARADNAVEFLKKFTSKNHHALSQYKSGECCNNCKCEEMEPLQKCRCMDMYEGEEACKKLTKTCEFPIGLLSWPPRCSCADITPSCKSCASTAVGAVGEAYIIERVA